MKKQSSTQGEVAIDRTEAANNTPTEYGDYINSCRECAKEHEQLAEWLEDYKRLLEERPQGEWVEVSRFEGDTQPDLKCPFCGIEIDYFGYDNFCPNCGADMRDEEK